MSSLLGTRPYLIAADIGTTSTKALVIRGTDGAIMASRSVEYPLYSPRAEVAEQDPKEIYEAVLQAVGETVRQAGIAPQEVLCISFSSAMHSLIAVDREGEPLTRCITWADNRAVHAAEQLKREFEGHQIYMRTGTPIHPMSPLAKLVWLRGAEPELHARTARFIGIKEYVLWRWFGRYVIDYSLATATGLFNLQEMDWDKEALQLAGVDPERLSKPVPTTYTLQGIHRDAAVRMGLSEETPVVVGASDGVLANLGSGASEPGIVAVTIGTSGAVRSVVRQPVTDPKGRLFCYALKEDYWVVGGAINNGGVILRWVRDQLATLEAEEGRRLGLDPYDYLTRLAAEAAPGSNGLLFLPYLTGERAPHWNANARGVFFGLSLAHEKKHMIRSVMEGVMFAIHSVAEALEELNGPAAEIRASGGFARSELWRQMLADVTGTPVAVPDVIEASGLGAAQLGLYALGETKDFVGIHQWVRTGLRHNKNPEIFDTYKRLTPIYQKVYHQLSRQFDDIAAFQQE